MRNSEGRGFDICMINSLHPRGTTAGKRGPWKKATAPVAVGAIHKACKKNPQR